MNYLEMGADPRLCNGEGRNCLHLCSQSGLIGLFMHLLEMYQMDIMCMDSSMFTPLHIAISERREEMALLIISLSPKIDIENESGKSVLALAVDLGSYRITRHLLLNKVNKPNYTANVLEIEGKCEDRDILKLLVRFM